MDQFDHGFKVTRMAPVNSSDEAGPPTPRAPRSPWGTGPWIGLATAGWFAVVVAIDRLTLPLFQIRWLHPDVSMGIGITLLVAGFLLYGLIWRFLHKALRDNRLLTTGPYRIVRHPLYSIALFLLCPGACFLLRSYLVLTTPLFMAIIVARAVRVEEERLLADFGDEYERYRETTGAVWPRS